MVFLEKMAAIPKGKGVSLLFCINLSEYNIVKEIGKDMVVLFEDQQKINLFAKKNSLLNDIKDQITEKEVFNLYIMFIFN